MREPTDEEREDARREEMDERHRRAHRYDCRGTPEDGPPPGCPRCGNDQEPEGGCEESGCPLYW